MWIEIVTMVSMTANIVFLLIISYLLGKLWWYEDREDGGNDEPRSN